MQTKQPHLRLVVDSDLPFIESLRAESEKSARPLLTATDGKTAQMMIADPANQILSVFVNLALPGGFGLSVVRFAHRYRPATPIYIIENPEAEPLTGKELSRLGIQNCIKKPASLSTLYEYPNSKSIQYDPKLALDLSNRNADAVDMAVGVEDTAFIPILAEHFLSGTTSYFDIYIKLASGRYIKILKAGDSFSEDRIASYIKKGIVHFYLRKEAQEIYLNYCDTLAGALIKSDKVTPKIQITHTLNHGQQFMAYMEAHGVDHTSMQYANEFVGNVKTLVAKFRPKSNVYVDEFLSNVAAFEHGVGTTIVSAMLANAIGMTSSNPAQLVGMASLMHDIGLLQFPELKDFDEDETKMTPEQKSTFRNHPIIGSEILRSFRKADPTTVQAVLQHHERRNQKGFPNHLAGGNINRVSEIIGLSDQFVRYIKVAKSNPLFDPVEEILKTIGAEFSFGLGEAFRTIFVKPKKKSG